MASETKYNLKREIKLLGRILIYVISILIEPAIKCIERKETLWVFGNVKFFGDNPKYMLEYVSEHEPRIKCVWVAHNNRQKYRAQKAGYSSVLAYSPLGIWYILKAGVGVIQGNHKDLNQLFVHGMHIVQLWHGFPIAKAILDHPEDWKSRIPYAGTLVSKLSKQALRRNYQADQVFVSSRHEGRRLSSALGVNYECMEITGTPREDVILKDKNMYKSIKNDSIFKKNKHSVLYAPTYRVKKCSKEFEQMLESMVKSEEISGMLKETNSEIIIKLHPFMSSFSDYLSKIKKDGIKIIGSRGPKSANILLEKANLLITDYSSVVLDFVLLERPIIFFAFDLETYKTVRPFYNNYEDVTNGHEVYTLDGLKRELGGCLKYEKKLEKHMDNSTRLKKKFKPKKSVEIRQNILKRIKDIAISNYK